MKKLIITALLILAPLTSQAATLSASKIESLVNLERLTPLTHSQALCKVAQSKLNDMVAYGYFAHLDPWFWFTANGYAFSYAGENLARNYATDKATVKAWMASPSHKKNILNALYTDTCVVSRGSLVVQGFAKPQ